jgi:ribosome biogenesis protein MAK21
MAGGGVLGGGGGGKSSKGKKNAPEEKKRTLRPGDLPPRRGRAWNPGAGPRPEGGGGGGDGDQNHRLSNVWHEASDTLALPAKVAKTAKELPQKDIDAKEQIAIKALEERATHHEKQSARSGSTDSKWLSLVRTSGTAADKIAAATVLAQEDPVANLKSLEHLLALLEKARVKGGKRGAVQAVGALVELFRDNLLPPKRKLLYFSEQPLSVSDAAPNERKRLLYWHVEDLVKRAYSRFVNALDALSRDPLPVLKEKALKAAYELLKSRPENERALLAILVNKLGDPVRRTASNAAHVLLELVSKEHPAMKRIVAREVETFCFRKGVGLKAQYYAAVLLNQFPLSHAGDGERLAAQLVEFYFALFQVLHKRSKETLESGGEAAEKAGAKPGDKKNRWRDGGKGGGGKGYEIGRANV